MRLLYAIQLIPLLSMVTSLQSFATTSPQKVACLEMFLSSKQSETQRQELSAPQQIPQENNLDYILKTLSQKFPKIQQWILLTSSEKEFLFSIFMEQVTGSEFLLVGFDVHRELNAIRIPVRRLRPLHEKLNTNVDFKDLEFSWRTNITQPELHESHSTLTLLIPKDYNLKSHKYQLIQLLRKMLVGHPLHPQILTQAKIDFRRKTNSPVIYLKEVQKTGMQVIDQAVASDSRKLLIVGTTGLGKTELLLHALRKNLTSKTTGRFHIVLVDSRSIWTQLYGTLAREQQNNYHQFTFKTWGAGNYDFTKEEALRLLNAGKTVVLLSTTRTFIDNMGDSNLFDLMSRSLAGLYYDEVHHLGAEQTWQTLKALTQNNTISNPFLLGMSATPYHYIQNIDSFFQDKIWWAYLDSVSDFQQILAGKKSSHQISDIVKQYALSHQNGDITPLQNAYFLFPEFFKTKDLFVQLDPAKLTEYDLGENEFNAGFRYLFDPKYNKMLIQFLRPLLAANDKTLLIATTVAQAKILEKDLQEMGYAAKALYSKMSEKAREDVESEFSTGKTKILITVRMYDEGVDRPALSLLIDLNPLVRPKAFWQRLGRVSRLYLGKKHANLVSFLLTNPSQQQEQLDLIQIVLNEKRLNSPDLTIQPTPPKESLLQEDPENINPYATSSGEIELNPNAVQNAQRTILFRIQAQKFEPTPQASRTEPPSVSEVLDPTDTPNERIETPTKAVVQDLELSRLEGLRLEMQKEFSNKVLILLRKIIYTRKFEIFQKLEEKQKRLSKNNESGFISLPNFEFNFLNVNIPKLQHTLEQRLIQIAKKQKIDVHDPGALLKDFGIDVENQLKDLEYLEQMINTAHGGRGFKFVDSTEMDALQNEIVRDLGDWQALQELSSKNIGSFNTALLSRIQLSAEPSQIDFSNLTIKSKPGTQGTGQIQSLVVNALQMSAENKGVSLIMMARNHSQALAYLEQLTSLTENEFQSAIYQLLMNNPPLDPILEPLLTPTRHKNFQEAKDFRGVPYEVNALSRFHCFTCNMKILTTQGYRPIGELKVGDVVLSWNTRTNSYVPNPIVKILETNNTPFGELRSDAALEPIEVTDSHPFYLPDLDIYKPLSEIQMGERLLGLREGLTNHQVPESLTSYIPKGIAPVRNLSLKYDPNNFIVNGVLVHNKFAR